MSKETAKLLKDVVNHAKYIKKNLHKHVKDLLSEDYHALQGTWSSSQFKDLLDDEDVFIKKYIKREIDRVEREAFDTGTYFHTACLEPHKINQEIAVFEGKKRYGKEWEKFKIKSAGKTMISITQKQQGDIMVNAVKNSPTSCKYLKGEPEVSLFVKLAVYQGRVYAPTFNKVLTKDGWVKAKAEATQMAESKGHPIVVKVRADCLGDTFVSDLKSTSGNARSAESIRGSISKYVYDLSAALYLDMFSLVNPSVHEFIWIFASKSAHNAQAWRATGDQIRIGRAKYMYAMIKLADCAASNWEVVDCLREAEPLPYEREWLIERDADLL